INKNERNYFKPVPSSLTFVKISFVLLLPQIAVQIYTSLNTTLVGILTDSLQVSYYDQSQKISRMVLAIVTSISVVLMPRLAEKKDDKEIFNMVSTSLFYTTFVSALFLVIVSSNSNTFVPWFFGDEFLSMRVNMKLSSLIILFISFGGVFSTQFALARGYDKEFSIPYYIGVFTNIGLNLVLIPKFGALGASVTLVLTEITVCFFRVFIVRKKIDLKKLLDDADILKILIIALISFSISILPIFNFENPLFEMLLRSIVISFVFMFLSIILKTRILNDFQIFLKKYNGRK
ncbi:TPA: lipopolysaccharide biosynthesis protein, partial [Enterococcus faecium]